MQLTNELACELKYDAVAAILLLFSFVVLIKLSSFVRKIHLKRIA